MIHIYLPIYISEAWDREYAKVNHLRTCPRPHLHRRRSDGHSKSNMPRPAFVGYIPEIVPTGTYIKSQSLI